MRAVARDQGIAGIENRGRQHRTIFRGKRQRLLERGIAAGLREQGPAAAPLSAQLPQRRRIRGHAPLRRLRQRGARLLRPDQQRHLPLEHRHLRGLLLQGIDARDLREALPFQFGATR